MLAVAARHVAEHGWRNVELLATPAQDAMIAEPADAALFCAVHAPFVRDFTGFDCPWRRLAELVDDLRVTEVPFGAGYLALGRAPD